MYIKMTIHNSKKFLQLQRGSKLRVAENQEETTGGMTKIYLWEGCTVCCCSCAINGRF